ncbi:hypothetical protein SARC_06775 [Sphaeroforma arctica JP610]|uniref:Uncharacterized protein n=1 Tax=Sphaeroforma arctica JP610 TaxID=667725 RepID=A0A0L0FWC9_9EUKA|nr:hypothetical protein SARC_06775 [Sphaeroforma arctica JP610]KNC80876.1 hypothetical protein SARC_06775 [Sphaeroforma arctica JP610]|eukprot:XP_014154778.1 hypothetical protein SARC_06775 [Sphaeroforma arctica JP610]
MSAMYLHNSTRHRWLLSTPFTWSSGTQPTCGLSVNQHGARLPGNHYTARKGVSTAQTYKGDDIGLHTGGGLNRQLGRLRQRALERGEISPAMDEMLKRELEGRRRPRTFNKLPIAKESFIVEKGLGTTYWPVPLTIRPSNTGQFHNLLLDAAKTPVRKTRKAKLTSTKEIEQVLSPVLKGRDRAKAATVVDSVTNSLIMDRKSSAGDSSFLQTWDDRLATVVRECETHSRSDLAQQVLAKCSKQEMGTLGSVRQSRFIPYAEHIRGLLARDEQAEALQVLADLYRTNHYITSCCFEPIIHYYSSRGDREGILNSMNMVEQLGGSFNTTMLNSVIEGFLRESSDGLLANNFDTILPSLLQTIGAHYADTNSLQLLLNKCQNGKDLNFATKILGLGVYTNGNLEYLTMYILNWSFYNPQAALYTAYTTLDMVLRRRTNLDGGESMNMIMARGVELGRDSWAYRARLKPAFDRTCIWPSTVQRMVVHHAHAGEQAGVMSKWRLLQLVRSQIRAYPQSQADAQRETEAAFVKNAHPGFVEKIDPVSHSRIHSQNRDDKEHALPDGTDPSVWTDENAAALGDIDTAPLVKDDGALHGDEDSGTTHPRRRRLLRSDFTPLLAEEDGVGAGVSDAVCFLKAMGLLGDINVLDRYSTNVRASVEVVDHEIQSALIGAYLNNNLFDAALSLTKAFITRNKPTSATGTSKAGANKSKGKESSTQKHGSVSKSKSMKTDVSKQVNPVDGRYNVNTRLVNELLIGGAGEQTGDAALERVARVVEMCTQMGVDTDELVDTTILNIRNRSEEDNSAAVENET